jgi:Met-zincin
MATSRHWMGILAAGLLAAACQGQIDGSTETEEQARIVEHLRAQGIHPDDVEFRGEDVVIEGDFILTRARILAGLAGRAASQADADDEALVLKGYRYRGLRPSVSPIGVRIPANVPLLVRHAVQSAARTWSDITGCIKIHDFATGGIDLPFVYFAYGTVQGQAQPPDSNGLPQGMGINRNWVESENPSIEKLTHVAMHEMGHALGFTHPREGSHIHTTNTYKKVCGVNGQRPAYPTVMDYCNDEGHPTADDRKSLQLVYGMPGRCKN